MGPGAAPPPRAAASVRGGSSGRWRLRNWRLRSKLALLLVLPLALVLVLAGLRVQSGVSEAGELAAQADRIALSQQVQATVQAVQRERAAAAGFAGSNRREYGEDLESRSGDTNGEIERLRAAAALDAGDTVAAALRAANGRLDGLTALRNSATGSAYPADDIIAGYTSVIATLRDLDTLLISGTGGELQGESAGITSLADAKEQISRQHATLLAVLSGSGRPSPRQVSVLRDADAEFASALVGFSNAISPQGQQLYTSTVTGVVVDDRERIKETAVVLGAAGEPVGVGAAQWDIAATGNADLIRQVEVGLVSSLAEATSEAAAAARADALRASVIVGVLVLLAVVVLLIVVRSLLRPLRILRIGAFDVASRRLPAAIEAMKNTDEQPSETTVEPIGVDTREELGEVARAFDAVHREAIRLAAEQALLRTNINDIFVNLSRRSQALVKRQLGLIDKLESDEQDPEHLGNLFQLDHLATRMRRNNENLLVLAGAAELRPRRRRPVPVDDVLRAAVSEIEQYQRVTVRRAPALLVAGPVVNDLVHLVAELLDNATSFSPPDSTVVLASSLDGRGALVIDITDSGVGIDDNNLHMINAELADPPTVDVAVSRRMGLFVVGRLAQRNDISVRLQPVVGGQGLRALVTVPPMMLTGPDGASGPGMGTNSELPAAESAWGGAGSSGPAAAGFERSAQGQQARSDQSGPNRPGPGWPGGPTGAPFPQPRAPQRSGWDAPPPSVPAPRRDADSRPMGRGDSGPMPIAPSPAFPGPSMPQQPPAPQADAPFGAQPPARRADPLTDLFESVSGEAAPDQPDVPIYDEVRTSWFRLQMRQGGDQQGPPPEERPGTPNGSHHHGNGHGGNGNGQGNGQGNGAGPRSRPGDAPDRGAPDAPAREDAWSWSGDAPRSGTPELPVRRPGAAAGLSSTEEATTRVPAQPERRTQAAPAERAPARDEQPQEPPERQDPGERSEPGERSGSQARAGSAAPEQERTPAVSEWGPIDNGWLAAREFAEFTKEHLTENGLPKRAPRARLIPGGAAATVIEPRPRNADAVRGRLTEYQRGLRQGRYSQADESAGGDEHPAEQGDRGAE
ncbi:sensor histidine kinase [Pseudonocardia humida]|uniref:histidine kinase n=1 Tax=Pseudonocardia humida TaxID=2800819 RepID=A0ABT1A2S6_9PSEU|nr:nitrate- and nitrite sensing domain-containing protein [Pseudonocardia humida]MCO1657295.1 nitrate- and nitrite sensing domain-containing protein [Pseudonocardia humida]